LTERRAQSRPCFGTTRRSSLRHLRRVRRQH